MNLNKLAVEYAENRTALKAVNDDIKKLQADYQAKCEKEPNPNPNPLLMPPPYYEIRLDRAREYWYEHNADGWDGWVTAVDHNDEHTIEEMLLAILLDKKSAIRQGVGKIKRAIYNLGIKTLKNQ
jgi:hypothetical protein